MLYLNQRILNGATKVHVVNRHEIYSILLGTHDVSA